MKKIKLFFMSLICALLLAFTFTNINIKATVVVNNNITVEGAQIRTIDPMGLRFVGNVKNYDVTDVTDYGIVLAFGKANATENFVIGGTVNGKTVINGEVKNTKDGIFTVTLIDIPESMYAQEISARAYVKKGTSVLYGEKTITKSLANGALASKTNGITSPVIDNIINVLNTNYLIRGKGYSGNVEYINSLIEDKYFNLEKEFLNDWNKKFGTSLTKVDASFHASATIGTEKSCAKNSNLYKFFNDVDMKAKWDWLLDFFLTRPDKAVHPVRQINALRSPDGTASDEYGDGMNHLEHLNYSFINFFNNTANNTPNFVPIKFGDISMYDRVKEFSKIYIDLNNYELININQEFKIVYNLRGRNWGYTTKKDAVEGFLKDFYDFLGKPGTLDEFMYGGTTPNNYQGTWKTYLGGGVGGTNKLIKDNDASLNDEAFFFNSTKYKTKWAELPTIVRDMNSDNPRFGNKGSYWGGALDFRRYIDENLEGANYNDKINTYPVNTNEPTVLTYKYSDSDITLHTPFNPDFVGWYDNPDFIGEKITTIPTHSMGDKEYFAKYKGDEEKANLVNLSYDGTPVKYRGTNTIVQIPDRYIQPDEQMRAVWVSPLVGDYKPSPNETTMKQNLLEVLSVLEKYNLNTINFHIRIANDALYDTDMAPIHPDLGSRSTFAKWDYLTWFINECHSRGIEFHAWMNPYRIKSYGYPANATPADVAKDYVNYPKNPAHKAENILLTYRDKGDHGAILNPCKTEVQDYIVNVCLEVMQKYDVDAIHFDDYFYAKMSSGIDVINEPDQGDYEAFISANPSKGYSATSSSDKMQWRRDNVDNFIYKLSTAMRKFNKDNKRAVQLGIAPTGIYKNGNGSVESGSNTAGQEHYKSYLFCDTKKWILNEWIDYICPQSYWGFTHKVAGYADVMDWWNKVVDGKKVNLYSGIGLYMNGENVSDSWKYQPYEVSNQILYTTKLKNCKGVSFFAYKQLKNYGSNPDNTTYLGLERLRTEYWTYKVKTPTTFADTFLK